MMDKQQARIQQIRERLQRIDSSESGGNWHNFSIGDVRTLLSEIDRLHAQYAHEGGKPQIMTESILKKWIATIDVPKMIDIYQTSAPNVFYASFDLPLYPEHRSQLRALNVEVVDTNSTLRNRYMLKWRTPPNDEF